MNGRWNLMVGLWGIGFFMIYGFVLIYLRDFAPDAAEWAASYGSGKHFEARLAHVHGALFTFLNIVIGYLLLQLPIRTGQRKFVAVTALLGILMPVGILAEILVGAPPVLVLVGGLSLTVSVFVFGYEVMKMQAAETAARS
jgi:hypothetical protein